MKYEVQLTLEVHTLIAVEAEDETGAAQTVVTKTDLIRMAADNPCSVITEIEVSIYPQGLLNCSPKESMERQKQIVTFSSEEIAVMVNEL